MNLLAHMPEILYVVLLVVIYQICLNEGPKPRSAVGRASDARRSTAGPATYFRFPFADSRSAVVSYRPLYSNA